jgi:uncharacterized protein
VDTTKNYFGASEDDYLYKQQSQIPQSGYGLYTAIDIFQDETVAVFRGEILSNKEAKKRADKGEDQYFVCLWDGRILDSNQVECWAKYANDAKGPNARAFKNNVHITFNENNEVCLTALRNIKAYEELFCAYGDAYWKKHLPGTSINT